MYIYIYIISYAIGQKDIYLYIKVDLNATKLHLYAAPVKEHLQTDGLPGNDNGEKM